MRVGDKIHRLVSRDFRYFVQVPAPYNLAQCEEHLSKLEPRVREGLDIVELVVTSVRQAVDVDTRDTTPAPPMLPDARDVRATMETLDGETARG
jgi:hypothetical protein